MFFIFSDQSDDLAGPAATATTLDQAFAWVACRCGYAHHFELCADAWKLHLIDVERPERNPDPILSTMKRAEQAKRDLIKQAVDGRLKGFVALPQQDYERYRQQLAEAV